MTSLMVQTTELDIANAFESLLITPSKGRTGYLFWWKGLDEYLWYRNREMKSENFVDCVDVVVVPGLSCPSSACLSR